MLKLLKRIFHFGGDSAAPKKASVVEAPKPSSASRPPEGSPGIEVASLSLRSILDRFPQDLKGTIQQMPSPDVKVVLPVNAIMKQLPTGTVRMSLASLHRQAPNGIFRKGNVEEKRMVEVPLGEIFKTISPAKLKRRNDQRQYEVPDDVSGLFGSDGKSRDLSTPSAEVAPAPAPEAPKPATIEAPKVLKMPGVSPAAPAAVPKTVLTTNGAANGQASVPSTIKKTVSAPASAPAPSSAQAAPLKLDGSVTLSVVELAAGWPEGIRNELSVLTGDTRVVIPTGEVGPMLQKGKVAFTWAQLQAWIQPPAPKNINIPEGTVLTLPLKVVAPAFVAATGARKRQSDKAVVNEQLPDFFGPNSGRPPEAAAPATAPTAAPEPATEIVASPAAPLPVLAQPAAPASVAPVAQAEPQSLAELFSKPGQADWSPNELVRLTCCLPGITGAVVALEEGLVVAQQLPAGLVADTMAAFMPQIFSRLDKYTHEMQLGETRETTVETASGPARFYRRGKVFFAVTGKSGASIPAAVRLVADELERQNA